MNTAILFLVALAVVVVGDAIYHILSAVVKRVSEKFGGQNH